MATIRHYIKANWFPIALILLALIAVMRRQKHLPADAQHPAPASAEKYTDDAGTHVTASRLGIVPEGRGHGVSMPDIPEEEAEAFLRRFSKVAIGERKKFGVPASVILAHAYVNSFAGRRKTVLEGRNFTALSCSGDWDGPTFDIDGHCFRQYETAWESFRDFSIFLAAQNWVAETRTSAGKKWKPWVKAFHQHGLSDVSGYPEHMEAIIEAYRLFELDE